MTTLWNENIKYDILRRKKNLSYDFINTLYLKFNLQKWLLKDIIEWFWSTSIFSTHEGLPFWCTWYFWWGWLTVHYAHVHHMRESSHLGWKQWCAWKNPIIDKIIIILSILILIFPHDTAFEKISFSPWVLHQPAVTTKWAVRAVGRDGALQLEL